MTERRTMLPGSPDDPYILEPSEDKAPVAGSYADGTVSDFDWCCSGCGRTLFRQFAPTVPLMDLSCRCACGQINRFRNPS